MTSYKLCKRVWVDVWISAHVSLVAKPPSDVLRQAYVPPLFIFWGTHVLACVDDQLEQAQKILFTLDSCIFLNIDIINQVHILCNQSCKNVLRENFHGLKMLFRTCPYLPRKLHHPKAEILVRKHLKILQQINETLLFQ